MLRMVAFDYENIDTNIDLKLTQYPDKYGEIGECAEDTECKTENPIIELKNDKKMNFLLKMLMIQGLVLN